MWWSGVRRSDRVLSSAAPDHDGDGHEAGYPPKAPGAGKPHARMCESEAEWLSYSTTGRRSPQAPSGHRAIAYGRSRRPGGHRRPAGPAARRAGPRAASWRPCVRPPRHRPPDRRTRRRPVHDGRRVHGSIGDRADQQCAAGAATPGPAPAVRSPPPTQTRIDDALRDARAANTRAQYRSAWRGWAAWCADHGHEAMPADPLAVAAYLAERTERGAADPTAYDGVRRVLQERLQPLQAGRSGGARSRQSGGTAPTGRRYGPEFAAICVTARCRQGERSGQGGSLCGRASDRHRGGRLQVHGAGTG